MIHIAYTSEIKKPADFTKDEVDRWSYIQSQSVHLQKAFLSFSFSLAVASLHPFAQVCIIRKKREIVAFLPFEFKDLFHKKIKVAERIGGELSDYFGIIAVSDFVISMRQLSRLCGINFMHYTHLDQSQTAYGFPEESPEKVLLINIGTSGAEYFQKLKEKNNKFILDTARQERKIEKDIGYLKFCYNVPLERRQTVLEELIQQKREQYLRTNVPDCLDEKWKRVLLHKLAAVDNEDCKGILSTLHAGEMLIACHFGLQGHDIFHYWFPVYNPKVAKYSPGRLLLKYLILSSTSLRYPFAVIDMGAGVTKAKTDFANAEHLSLRGNIYSVNFTACAYRLFCSLKWRCQKK